MPGPADQYVVASFAKSETSRVLEPNVPTSVNFGNKSAVATPIRALAAISCCSACRTSGLRRKMLEGKPTGTTGGLLGSFGSAAAEQSAASRASSSVGCLPSKIASE